MRTAFNLLLLAASVLAACDASTSPENATQPGDISFDEGVLMRHVRMLAADSSCGRPAGSPYERRAAEYIRDAFIEYGLEPGTPEYFQQFPIGPGRVLAQTNETVAGREAAVICDPTRSPFSQNVIGILPGEGALAGQWIVIGAHYDHLGWDEPRGTVRVFNGADDNASGTATVLEAARLLSRFVAAHPNTAPHRRSIMFHAYGAEEEGLVGSLFYVSNPTVAMDSIVAMVNLDMVGRLRDNVLFVIGTVSYPGWNTLLETANDGDLRLVFTAEFASRSDQFGFLVEGVPVAFLHTGLHAEYHTALDDPDRLNSGGMKEVGELALALLWELAVGPPLSQPQATVRQ